MTNQNGFDSDSQEEYYRQKYNEQQQEEPDVVPCFKCKCQMYETTLDPKYNICENCK